MWYITCIDWLVELSWHSSDKFCLITVYCPLLCYWIYFVGKARSLDVRSILGLGYVKSLGSYGIVTLFWFQPRARVYSGWFISSGHMRFQGQWGPIRGLMPWDPPKAVEANWSWGEMESWVARLPRTWCREPIHCWGWTRILCLQELMGVLSPPVSCRP